MNTSSMSSLRLALWSTFFSIGYLRNLVRSGPKCDLHRSENIHFFSVQLYQFLTMTTLDAKRRYVEAGAAGAAPRPPAGLQRDHGQHQE